MLLSIFDRFYVTDIPEISLEDGHNFSVVESSSYEETGVIITYVLLLRVSASKFLNINF